MKSSFNCGAERKAMVSLRQQHRYGLSCGKIHGPTSTSTSTRTLIHVKLTEAAIRALEAHRSLQECLPGQPSICFQGNRGYIKIPAAGPQPSSALGLFTFYLCGEGREQPQASFDCIHHYVSSDGREQLEGQGLIQDKMRVCATADSYQVTRHRMSQVEKDSWSRSAIQIKAGASHQIKGIRFHSRLTPPGPSGSSFQKPSASSSRRNGCVATSTHKPFRERIIHLLALKAYRKPELLLWMEGEGAGVRDKAELGAILEEVAKVNPRDGSYLLRDHFYKLVQKDWPGYSKEERQLIGRLLARKLLPNSSYQPKNLPANLLILKSSDHQNHSSVTNAAGKRLLAVESLERLDLKRQKLAEQRSQQQLAENGPLSRNRHDATSPSVHPKLPSKTTFTQADAPMGIHNAQNGFSRNTQTVPEDVKKETKVEPQNGLNCPHPLITVFHKKKKSKRHKDRDCLTNEQGDAELETNKLKQKPGKTDNSDVPSTGQEKPDYSRMYSPVMSLEQRHRYQEEFCSEYDEYKDLHSRIVTTTHMFVQLGSKLKSLSPGTPQYKIMEDQILEKYSNYQKKFPGYKEEKKRCKYLHEKLSYIKQLIIHYDKSQASSPTAENVHSG